MKGNIKFRMKILFIWPAVTNAALRDFLPLGLGYLAANLPDKYQIGLWDGVLEGYRDNTRIVEEISQFQPELIGLSIWNFNLKAARQVTDLIKAHFPELPIVVGGPSVSGYREQIFNKVHTDYGIIGEGEESFRQFLELYSKHALTPEDLNRIDGLIYRGDNGHVVCNPPHWRTLEGLKYCDYTLLNLNQYLATGYRYGIHQNAERTAPLQTTRGCPFSCEYCSACKVNGKKVRTRPIASIIDEIRELYEKFQVNGFNIVDDNFTFQLDFAKEVCRAIINLRVPNISFCSPNGVKVEYLDEELLALMKQAGWEWLFIAPESGSMQTLKNMRKHVDLKIVKEQLTLIKAASLNVFGFFMIGYPGETVSDIKKTIDFACQNDFDAVVFTCFKPLAGTPVYKKLVASGEISELSGNDDYYEISYAPEGISIAQMKFWRFWGLFRFYTRSWKRLKTALSNYSLRQVLTFVRKIII